MRFQKSWFNPFRNPFSLWKQFRAGMEWQKEYEKEHPVYREESEKFLSAGIGLLIQLLIIIYAPLIGVLIFD